MKMRMKSLACLTLASVAMAILVANTVHQRKQIPKLRSLRDIRDASSLHTRVDSTRMSFAAPSHDRLNRKTWEGPGQFESTSHGFKITLDDKSWFEPGTAQMTTQGIHEVNRLAIAIRGALSGWKSLVVQVEGHTNSAPVVRHKKMYASNWELSGSRAFTVVRLLEVNGFARERLSGVGYADSRTEASEAQRKIVIQFQYPEIQEIAQR